ncbi:Pre-mRNA-splicing helicase BRR2 [Castilleja foliolosa]|uniref:Pre-mRNA-splicing helicase BRR2 n=1 Tax=Castilleja foliolosa TaxID=1961234 RepID=A0ABD3DPQ4_9LAMI
MAQAAFQGCKSFNHIQSRIYQTTYHRHKNILVCAPTGAGKTNITMVSILHKVVRVLTGDMQLSKTDDCNNS